VKVIPLLYSQVLNKSVSLPSQIIHQSTPSWSPVDFRTRFWYTQALNSPDRLGMEVRINAAVGVPTVVLAHRVLQPGTMLPIGVASVSYYLETVSSVIRKLDLKGGVLYFTNGSHLFSDSDPDDYQLRNAGISGTLLRANESSSALIREAAAFIASLGPPSDAHSAGRKPTFANGDLTTWFRAAF
jgi:hypothetical protein